MLLAYVSYLTQSCRCRLQDTSVQRGRLAGQASQAWQMCQHTRLEQEARAICGA